MNSRDRLKLWLKALAYRYHYHFGMEKNFICDWIHRLNNENENEVDEVMIKLSNVQVQAQKVRTLFMSTLQHF